MNFHVRSSFSGRCGGVVSSAAVVAQAAADFDKSRDKSVEVIMATKSALDRKK